MSVCCQCSKKEKESAIVFYMKDQYIDKKIHATLARELAKVQVVLNDRRRATVAQALCAGILAS